MSSAREMGDYVKIVVVVASLFLMADILAALWCCHNGERVGFEYFSTSVAEAEPAR